MKFFVAKHYLIALFILFLIFALPLVFFWNTLKSKPYLSPLVYLVESKDTEEYELKNLKVKSYGFLPFWSANSYVPNYEALTDIAYFSLYLDSDGTIKRLDDSGNLEPGYNNLKNNKRIKKILNDARRAGVRPSLTVSLHKNDDIEAFLNCSTCWNTSYREISKMVEDYKFLGINFDFEYMGDAPLNLSQKYTNYIEYMSTKFKEDIDYNFQIVVSVFADSAKKPRLTDISSLSKSSLDYIFIMAYDFFVPTSPTSGPIAPIGGAPDRYKYDLSLMFEDFKAKAPSTKLILGIAFYGHNWVVQNHSPLATRIPGNNYLGYSISQNYKDIKKKIDEEGLKVGWDAIAQAPFINYYKGSVARKIYFENEKSISKKIELAKQYSYAGIGIWALGYDGKYENLINLYKNFLESN